MDLPWIEATSRISHPSIGALSTPDKKRIVRARFATWAWVSRGRKEGWEENLDGAVSKNDGVEKGTEGDGERFEGVDRSREGDDFSM